MMTQIRVERSKRHDRSADAELLPRDPRDPDIVRAKARSRAERSHTEASCATESVE